MAHSPGPAQAGHAATPRPDRAPRTAPTGEGHLPATLRRAARLGGLAAMALGAAVLAGWALELPRVTSLLPGLPPMVPNTALALALAGLALWLHLAGRTHRRSRLRGRASLGLAAAVSALSGLSIAGHLLGWALPIDTALLPAWADQGQLQGRLPLNTAISLLCAGLALLLLAAPGQAAAGSAQLLGLLAGLNGVRVLLGYLDEGGAYAIAAPAGVAVHTATALILLGLGLLCARPREGLMAVASSPGHGSQIFRLMLPAGVLLPLLIGALTLRGRLAGLFSLSFGLIVLTLANLLVLWWLARALNRSESAAVREAERARALLELAERRTGRLQALRRIDLAIIHEHNAVGAMLDTVLEQACDQLGLDAAAVLLVQPGSERLTYARQIGFDRLPPSVDAAADTGYLGLALRERTVAGSAGDPAAIAHAPPPPHLAEGGFRSGYAAPIVIERQISGVLEVASRRGELDAEGAEFLATLAGQAAIAMATFRLFTDLERSNRALVRAYDETLAGWSYALELRDGETRGHTQRVTELTLRLAEAFGLGADELLHIRRGAMLHDIGKLGVPDAVLLKPGRLSEDEWELMRLHPVYAYQWLRPIAYLWPALDIPYCHHERWDGTGYPRGLSGEGIPLAARIFAVVDVWDALCSERPYHPPWPAERVRAYIAEQAGSHFDPEVVATFLAVVRDEDAPQARASGG